MDVMEFPTRWNKLEYLNDFIYLVAQLDLIARSGVFFLILDGAWVINANDYLANFIYSHFSPTLTRLDSGGGV